MKTISLATGSLGKISLLEEVLRNATSQVNPQRLLYYGDPRGIPELREAIAKMHGVTEGEVLVTSSGQQQLKLVFDWISQKGPLTEWIAQEPGYAGAMHHLRERKAKPFRHESELLEIMDEWREYHMASPPHMAIYLTSTLHNPTGHTTDDETRKQIARFVMESETYLVEDNPYDFLYDGQAPKPISRMVLGSKSVFLGSFSKIVAPGLRVGYVIGTEKTIQELTKRKTQFDLFTSTLSQLVVLHALKQEYLPQLRESLRQRRCIAQTRLFTLDHTLDISNPMGGIFLYLRGMPEGLRTHAQEQYALTLDNDTSMYLDKKSLGTLRINAVQNTEEDLVEGLERLVAAIHDLR